jgi:diguanylate cyclase (GGDEF)-like protein
MLATSPDGSQGVDLSRFRTLNLTIRYTGESQYLRVAIRNFDPRFSKVDDVNSPKFNYVNIPTKDLVQPITIPLAEFSVAEWWSRTYNMPREYSRPDLGNATVFYVDLQGNLADTRHDIRIEKVEFVGDWISAERWYLGILCAWLILGATYGVSQWLKMRRAHRSQRRQIDQLAHEKDKYQKLSTIDALTGVMNRHGVDQFLAALSITHVSASVILLDLDSFKQINDERGHGVGDRVLRTMGEILRAEMPNTYAVGRWGGEEFVIVCPGASLEKAAELSEKLRQKIKETSFIPEQPLPVTASFGVAASVDDQTFEDAFRQADQALYLAKSRGRNCVVVASDEQMHAVTGAKKGKWALVSGRFKLHK